MLRNVPMPNTEAPDTSEEEESIAAMLIESASKLRATAASNANSSIERRPALLDFDFYYKFRRRLSRS
jgi:hypothetical protein